MLNNAIKIIKTLNSVGYTAFFCGGCVRDFFTVVDRGVLFENGVIGEVFLKKGMDLKPGDILVLLEQKQGKKELSGR
ncbi:MAG: hypothetical protein CEN91_239, partial [Candidatus Berkelbacteria bacterium Licking1014_85]